MSKVSRRKFIGSVAMAAGAGLLLDVTVPGQVREIGAAAGGTDGLSRLGWNSFLPFINTDFAFYTLGRGGNSIALRLVDMKDSRPMRARSRKTRQENFVLKFESEEPLPLGDRIYSVNHFNLGDFDLFITDAGRAGSMFVYTAVINRVTITEKR